MYLFQHPWGSLSASGSILASKLTCKNNSTGDWTYMRQSSHYFLWGCSCTHTAFSASYQFLARQRRHPLQWDPATNMQIWTKSVTSCWIAFLSNVGIEEAPGQVSLLPKSWEVKYCREVDRNLQMNYIAWGSTGENQCAPTRAFKSANNFTFESFIESKSFLKS